MLEVKQTEKDNGLVLSISFKLDKEDAAELIKDLQAYVDTPSFKGIDDSDIDWKSYYEAKAQNEAKNKLHKEMRRMFVDVLDSEYLETKFATTYKLDELNREIEITRKKLNELKNK
jgi:hypothetical protein